MLAFFLIFLPVLFVERLIGIEFSSGNVLALKVLFLTTGGAAYALGSIMAKLGAF